MPAIQHQGLDRVLYDTYRGRTRRGLSESTRRTYRRDMERWVIPHFAGFKLAEVEPPDVRGLIQHLCDAGLKPSSVPVLAPATMAAGLGHIDDEGKLRTWITLHTFRHTCASLLFEAGRDVRQVASWLGHADPAFTLRTYVHLMDEGIGDAAFLDTAVRVNTGSTGRTETAASANAVSVTETAV